MVVPAGVGVGVGVVGVGLGVGVFVFGAKLLLADTCMALAAKSIKTRAKTRKLRKTFFVCIKVPHLSSWMGSRNTQAAKQSMALQIFDPPSFWIHLMLPDMEIAKNSTLFTYFCRLVLPPF